MTCQPEWPIQEGRLTSIRVGVRSTGIGELAAGERPCASKLLAPRGRPGLAALGWKWMLGESSPKPARYDLGNIGEFMKTFPPYCVGVFSLELYDHCNPWASRLSKAFRRLSGVWSTGLPKTGCEPRRPNAWSGEVGALSQALAAASAALAAAGTGVALTIAARGRAFFAFTTAAAAARAAAVRFRAATVLAKFKAPLRLWGLGPLLRVEPFCARCSAGLIVECHRFLTALSVRPGKPLAMSAHRLPTFVWMLAKRWSSSRVHGSLRTDGSKWLQYLSRHCLPLRDPTTLAILLHALRPYILTLSMSWVSSIKVHLPLFMRALPWLVDEPPDLVEPPIDKAPTKCLRQNRSNYLKVLPADCRGSTGRDFRGHARCDDVWLEGCNRRRGQPRATTPHKNTQKANKDFEPVLIL